MSTLKVTNIESPSGGGVNAKITDINGGQLSNRNMIINGEHNVNQRDQGTFTPAHNDFCTDRWRMELSQSSKYTAEQSSTSPDGYRKSLKITSSSAFTPGASDYFLVTQDIEGYTTTRTAFGSSAAKSVTLSFWVRSSLTGTFSCAIRNKAFNRTHIKEYTISAADTWEHKTLTFPGITDGTWETGSQQGIRVNYSLGAGSDFHGAANTTLNTNDFATSSSTNVVSTNGATWFLTGVQFEVGDVATEFEHRSYADELAKCQRYFRRFCEGVQYAPAPGVGYGVSSTSAYHKVDLSPEMRSVPTLADFSNLRTDDVSGGQAITALSLVSSMSSTEAVFLNATSASGLTQYRPYALLANNTTGAKLDLSAEL